MVTSWSSTASGWASKMKSQIKRQSGGLEYLFSAGLCIDVGWQGKSVRINLDQQYLGALRIGISRNYYKLYLFFSPLIICEAPSLALTPLS